MIIRSLKIKGLYDQYDINWDLNKDVNILAGQNGSFKSTVLNALRLFLEGKVVSKYYGMKSMEVEFDDGSVCYFIDYYDSIANLKKRAETDSKAKEIVSQIGDAQAASNYIHGTINYCLRNGERLDISEALKEVNFQFISTFDVPIKDEDEAGKTQLDIKLDKLQSEYAYYLSDLSKKLTSLISQNKETIATEDINRIYRKRDMFLNAIDEAFESTGKRTDHNESKISILLNDGSPIDIKKLSSGEKQLLIILTAVLCERDQPFILLLDEPEISLHLEWQKTLIENIRNLNPNCQIILTTHSPGIIFNGFEEYVTETNDITKDEKA